MKILVVGDWVIDDYWLTSDHRSQTASRVGKRHLRALNDEAFPQVRTLAGAGRVTSLLYDELLKDNSDNGSAEIVALGFWHPSDTDLLAHVCAEPKLLKDWTPLRLELSRALKHKTTRRPLRLLNLAQASNKRYHGTTRVIRVLLQSGPTFKSQGRVDWETHSPTMQKDDPQYRFWEVPGNKSKVAKLLAKERFDAIIIKDQRKGVISKQMIEWLVENVRAFNGRKPKWFISTKAFRPPWLTALKEQDVQLLVIPEVAAHEAVNKLDGDIYSWFATDRPQKKSYPTHEALFAINRLCSDLVSANGAPPRVVILPGKFQVLARQGKMGVMQPQPEPIPYCDHAAMASAFFPYCVAKLLRGSAPSLQKLVADVLDKTAKFNREEADWIGHTETTERDFPKQYIEEFSWANYEENWELAWSPPANLAKHIRDAKAKKTATKSSADSKVRLELWRAMTEVPGYISIVSERRRMLARLIREIREFVNEKRERSISGLLIANPGTGKTSLVRAISGMFDVRPLEFNITQLVHRDDLVGCFDSIVTAQAQDHRRPVLAFFDEANAQIERQHVYDAMLSPLEDGVYMRGGRKFFLHPCIWLFASTEKLPETPEHPEDKSWDFKNRLTMGQIDLATSIPDRSLTASNFPDLKDPDDRIEEQQRMESVYRAVAMINSIFPDVREVSLGLLERFYRLAPGYSARELRRCISRLRNVQFGQLSLSNCPPELPKGSLTDADEDNAQSNDKLFVEIG